MRARSIQVVDISSTFYSAGDAIQHAIDLNAVALAKDRYRIPRRSRVFLEMLRDAPFVLHETAIPGVQIILNRRYKPLGFSGQGLVDWVNYEEYLNLHVRLSSDQISGVVSPGFDRKMFGETNAPWLNRKSALAYAHRLERLASFISSTADPSTLVA
jgi:hypothetical protein